MFGFSTSHLFSCLSRSYKVSSIQLASMICHFKCRNGAYPRTDGLIVRHDVPDDKVSWDVAWDQYNPPYFTSSHILNQSWADPELSDSNFKPLWNTLDGEVNRKSYICEYKIQDGCPVNPSGRTGLRGRGVLGRWGPNHAADPIFTKWKRLNGNIVKNAVSLKPILEFIAIKRRDCNEWAIPGGMVDPGEMVTTTLKREFLEEALNSKEMSSDEKSKTEAQLEEFISKGEPIYKGYVDDIRNTDNAWIETVVYNFHDDKGDIEFLKLNAGDDAIGVSWLEVSEKLPLYATHSFFLKLVAEKHGAHW